MKITVKGHEFEFLPGFWLTQIAWAVLNFTMGFLDFEWPSGGFFGVTLLAVVIITGYNVTIDGKGILEIFSGEEESEWESEK